MAPVAQKNNQDIMNDVERNVVVPDLPRDALRHRNEKGELPVPGSFKKIMEDCCINLGTDEYGEKTTPMKNSSRSHEPDNEPEKSSKDVDIRIKREQEKRNNSCNDSEDEDKDPEIKCRFPSAFYCPITKKRMNDPVVISDGISYERTAVDEGGGLARKYYPNLALGSIMNDHIERYRKESPLLQKSVLLSILPGGFFFERSSHRSLPEALYCPITRDLMHVPVIDPDGNTYEQAAIVSWIRSHHTSPISRTPLAEDDLFPNRAIEELLADEVNRSNESMHPIIREWKEESPPEILSLDNEHPAARDNRHHESSWYLPTTADEWDDFYEEYWRCFVGCGIATFCLMVLLIVLLWICVKPFAGYIVLVLVVMCLPTCCKD